MDNIDKATEDVSKMAASIASMEAKMEEILRDKAAASADQTRSNAEEKEIGKSYGFLNARKDVLSGKTAMAPLWDSKTENRFNEYLKMVNQKDYVAISKAFGDNVSDASNWSPTEFRSELVRLAYLNSMMLQKATIVPMGRDKIDLPAPTGNFTASWISAGSQTQDSKVTYENLELNSKKLSALAIVNQEDLNDSAYPLALFIANQMGEDIGQKIDFTCFQGTSADFKGLGAESGVLSVTGAVDATPTLAELFTEANILSMAGKLEDMKLAGAEWFMGPDAWAVIRGLTAGTTGSSIVRLNEGYSYDLLGYPVNRSAQVAPTPAASKAMAYFGNPKYIYIGDRMGFSIATSDQYKFPEDQVVFKATQRLAIAVGLPAAFVKLSFGAAS